MDPLTPTQPKRKWFWLGILFCFIAPPLPGLIYGIALLTEKEQRRDGIIVTAWAIIWFAIVYTTVTYLAARHLNASASALIQQYTK